MKTNSPELKKESISELEKEARQLRDSIYGKGDEKNWQECKDKWILDIAWLRKNGKLS